VSLLQLEITVDGVALPMHTLNWQRLDRWIPTFRVTLSDALVVQGTICAPGGYPSGRGFLIQIEVHNRGGAARDVQLRLHVAWQWTKVWITSPRPLPGRHSLLVDEQTLVLDASDGTGPALALGSSHSIRFHDHAGATLEAGREVGAHNGELLRATSQQTFAVQPQRRGSAAFFVGAGRERDGARAAVASMRRAGADFWIRQARLELSHMLRAGEDPRRAELFNRNLLFNRYFAVARGIDDDALYLLRSRSTRCPAPAVFNERETLFCTVPALMLADPGLAREAIFRAYDAFSERSGEYLRYVDGGTLDNAFVLEQLVLYSWVADYYVRTTGDETLLDEPLLRQLLIEADAALFTRLHPQHMLCATDLLASGDHADHAFPTFGNALAWFFCDALQRLWTRLPEEPPLRLEGAAQEISAAIWQHCTTDVDGATIFASSTNLEGDAAVYDDPAGSLSLLPFFGFCAVDDPVWSDTMAFLRSDRYPLWRNGAVPGLAARSQPKIARTVALCADMLGPHANDAVKRLLQLRLPSGVAAGGYDTDHGDVVEPHHAALAGLIAWSMPRAREPRAENARESRTKQRKK
jgi:hypothetical protein